MDQASISSKPHGSHNERNPVMRLLGIAILAAATACSTSASPSAGTFASVERGAYTPAGLGPTAPSLLGRQRLRPSRAARGIFTRSAPGGAQPSPRLSADEG